MCLSIACLFLPALDGTIGKESEIPILSSASGGGKANVTLGLRLRLHLTTLVRSGLSRRRQLHELAVRPSEQWRSLGKVEDFSAHGRVSVT
jgi:hypothetical protein